MKQFVLVLAILNLSVLGFAQPYLVEGNAFLEDATNHIGITVTYTRTAPTPLTYIVYTDTDGYFFETVEEGIYDISYEKPLYLTITTNDNAIYSTTVLPDVTLEPEGLSGELSGTLAAGKYVVSGDITVPEGETLIIEPGTTLKFKQDLNFIVRGSLYANGTANDSIVFQRLDNGVLWNGISVFPTATAEFSYVIIENATTSGIFIAGNCSIDRSTIRNNSGDYGGGVGISIVSQQLVFITNTQIYQNNANQGGGIYLGITTTASTAAERPVIANCLIYNNTANWGAGIYFYLWFYGAPRSPLITNCTFSDNICPGGSSGILECDQDTYIPTIVNNIISNNEGYGTKFNSSTQYFGFNNSFNNSSGNYFNPPANVGNNVTTNVNGDSCDAYHNIQLNPLFVDGNNFDYHLLDESPCIDVGLNDSIYGGFDFDGNTRIWDAHNYGMAVVDMGPYEFPFMVKLNEYNNADDNITCYPNPTDGIVNLDFINGSVQQIVITDIAGRTLIHKTGRLNNNTIDLSGLESGIYLVSILAEKEILTARVIKK